MYFDGEEEWDEDTEAAVRAMEEQAANKASAAATMLKSVPHYPPLQLKPAFPTTLPSIFNPSSFRLSTSKPAAQTTSKSKASMRKPYTKAGAKAKARASSGNSMGVALADPQLRDPDGDGDGDDGNVRAKGSSKLPPAFPSVSTESIGAPFIDLDKADTWIYPSNFPKRDYQYSIVAQSLFRNTLVSLPTGLGKTFIAAVVMYNFYRWYPSGKIVFMAPTKPLVAQQIKACREIVGLPMAQTAEMTGAMPAEQRRVCWRERRVFFVTPQILANDLESGYCPREKFVCVVVDEAHRAQGKYAYCTVDSCSVRDIASATSQFRVLALTATPGSNVAQVQHVLSNLLVSHLEVRSENDLDVRQYTHEKLVELITVPVSGDVAEANRLFIELAKIPITRLCNQGAFFQRDVEKVTQYLLVQEQKKLHLHPPPELQDQIGLIISQFGMAISLYSAWKMLTTHGLASARKALEDAEQKALQGIARNKKELLTRSEWIELLHFLREKQDAVSHPKIEKVEEIVMEHFNSRVMIFSSFRDSVSEISGVLERHSPLVKPMTFIGQSSQRTKGLSQKEQTRIVREFRDGRHNCLVSTSIDIGEVDLIICFDSQQSPIRLVQRMGRTGRKRQGRCVVLLSGSEEGSYKSSRTKQKFINKTMFEKRGVFNLYTGDNRMIPPEIKPKPQMVELAVPTAQEALQEQPVPLADPDVRVELDGEQQEYLQDKWTVTASQQPEALLRSLNRDAGRHAIPSPIYQVSHSRQCLTLMSAISWAEEHANDDPDAYENELLPFLVDSMVSEGKAARKRKAKNESPEGKAKKAATKEKKEKIPKDKKKEVDVADKKAKERVEQKAAKSGDANKKDVTIHPPVNKHDKFGFLKASAPSSPPRATPMSPTSLDSQHALVSPDADGGDSDPTIDLETEKTGLGTDKAKEKRVDVQLREDEDFADFEKFFPPIRTATSHPVTLPSVRAAAPSLPKAPVFPARRLSVTDTISPPSAAAATSPPKQMTLPSKPTTLSVAAPFPSTATVKSVPAAVATSMSASSLVSLLASKPKPQAAPKLTPLPVASVAPSVFRLPPSFSAKATPPMPTPVTQSTVAASVVNAAPKQIMPTLATATSGSLSSLSEAAPPANGQEFTSSPTLLSQPPPLPQAPVVLPKPPGLPSFNLERFAEASAIAPISRPTALPSHSVPFAPPFASASRITAAAPPSIAPPKPPGLPSFELDLNDLSSPLPSHTVPQPPIVVSIKPPAPAPVAKSAPPRPAVPLPSFDLDPFGDDQADVQPSSPSMLSQMDSVPRSVPLLQEKEKGVAAIGVSIAAQPRRLGLSRLVSKEKPAPLPSAPPPSMATLRRLPIEQQQSLPSRPSFASVTSAQKIAAPPSVSPPTLLVATGEPRRLSQLLDSEFTCPICNESLASEAAVSRHIDDAHGEGLPVNASVQKVKAKVKSSEVVLSEEVPKRKQANDDSVEVVKDEDEEEEEEKRKVRGDDSEEEEGERQLRSASKSRQITDTPASDADDFEDDKKRKTASAIATTSMHVTEQTEVQRAKIRRLQKRGKRVRVNRNAFLDNEAEVSGSDDDDEGDSDVEMLSQYEDDAALATPDNDAVSPSTMRGIYLQSLVSTPTKKARLLDFSSEESPRKGDLDSISSSSASPVVISSVKPKQPPQTLQPSLLAGVEPKITSAVPAGAFAAPLPVSRTPSLGLSLLKSAASRAPCAATASSVAMPKVQIPSLKAPPPTPTTVSVSASASSGGAFPLVPPSRTGPVSLPPPVRNANASFRSRPFGKR